MQPFLVPNVIAYPTKVNSEEETKEHFRVLFNPDKAALYSQDGNSEFLTEEQQIQEKFDNLSKPVLK